MIASLMINPRKFSICVISLFILAGCATAAETAPLAASDLTAPISLKEAQAEACPAALLDAGASPEDCACIESRLFSLGQTPGVLQSDKKPKAIFGGDAGRRKIAIGLLRHDAIEQCGLFDPEHVVAKNL